MTSIFLEVQKIHYKLELAECFWYQSICLKEYFQMNTNFTQFLQVLPVYAAIAQINVFDDYYWTTGQIDLILVPMDLSRRGLWYEYLHDQV